MNEQHAFWQHILTNPGEDAARLAYADWLDECDQAERAEFIRAQVGIAHTPACSPARDASRVVRACRDIWPTPHKGKGSGPHCGDCRQYVALRARENALLKAHESEWRAAPCPQCGGLGKTVVARTHRYQDCRLCTGTGDLLKYRVSGHAGWYEQLHPCKFGRGFVSEVEVRCVVFMREGFASALFRLHPIERVTFAHKDYTVSSWWGEQDDAEIDFPQYEDTTDFIPWVLFERLKGGRHPGGGRGRARHTSVVSSCDYQCCEDASEDLHNVVVGWGREQAELSTAVRDATEHLS